MSVLGHVTAVASTVLQPFAAHATAAGGGSSGGGITSVASTVFQPFAAHATAAGGGSSGGGITSVASTILQPFAAVGAAAPPANPFAFVVLNSVSSTIFQPWAAVTLPPETPPVVAGLGADQWAVDADFGYRPCGPNDPRLSAWLPDSFGSKCIVVDGASI